MSIRVVDIEVSCKKLSLYQGLIGDVSCVVWDAAIVLSKYLQRLVDDKGGSLLSGRRVLELGSGVGCVGLTAAVLGAEVTLTDLPEALPLIKQNISENKSVIISHGGFATPEVLTWGDTKSDIVKNMEFDYVFLADCIYYEKSIDPLIKTLVNINESSNKRAQFFISQELRDSEVQRNFWKLFLEKLNKYFNVETVPKAEQHPEYCSDDIVLLRCSKKIVSSEHTLL